MHDARTLLGLGARAQGQLSRRRYHLDLAALADLVGLRSEHSGTLDKLRAESNRLAREVRGADADTAARLRERARQVKEQIQQAEVAHRAAEDDLDRFLLAIPNLPSDAVPDGDSEAQAVEVRRVGEPRAFDAALAAAPDDHADLGERMGILDLKRAAKLSGARFSVTRGAGARLERALAAFFLDLHTTEHGYVEYAVPSLVNADAMRGTGQLPKFADDLFATTVGDRTLYLVPTAEVPLTNLYAGETLDASALPIALTGFTPCFRAEAGSYGKDTRGILRLHQFGKVELVRICHPDRSGAELLTLLEHAERCLQRLGLAYRVVLLAAGDMAFSARMTYDIEAWLPSQARYREISSCSDCGTFQGRRARIRVRGADGTKAPAATLNGSGLPIGRTMVAILEQYQQPDGGVVIPAALVPYTGFRRIAPDGSPES